MRGSRSGTKAKVTLKRAFPSGGGGAGWGSKKEYRSFGGSQLATEEESREVRVRIVAQNRCIFTYST